MSKTFETTVEIKGAIGSTFTEAFRKANHGLVDFKGEARAVQRELDRLGQDFRQGKIHQSQYTEESQKLGTELKTLEREMKDATAAQKRFAQETASAKRQLEEQTLAAKARKKAFMNDMGAGVSNATGKVKTAATVVGVGAAAGAAATAINSINVAAEFEAQLSTVGSKVQATTGEMNALRQSALALGASTSLDASTTAKAMDELAAKGMNANQIISAMPGIIAGAEASGEDLTLVSDVVTSAINAYGMQASEASRVSDIMTMSAIKSAAGVSDLGYSFKYASPIAKTLGISIEELAASTGLLVDTGLAGEQVGTALRQSFIRLSAPPTEAQKALKKLNLTAVDSKGKFKSLAQITEEWNEATKDLTDAQKVQNAAAVFGAESSTAMLSLFSKGADSIRDMTKALEESEGAAIATSKAMKDNFLGAKEQMMGAIDTAQIAFATPILPVLQDTMNGIGSIVENNIGHFENLGSAIATTLSDITAPIAMTEPIRPEIEPHMDPDYTEKAMAKYAADLEKYELFKDMSGSEKVHYMLDETISTVEEWVGGSGGAAMERLFTEVGTVAGKAWWGAFKTSAMGAVGELAEGNLAGAAAMAAVANSLTGGMLVTTAGAGTKYVADKAKEIYTNSKGDKKPTKATATATSIPVDESSNEKSKPKSKGKKEIPPKAIVKHPPNLSGKITAIASKATVPLAAVASLFNIATSDNKAEATGSAAGGFAGGVGGAKLGATIGTLIAPGIGTAVGGFLGSIGGSLFGSWFGGKAGNAIAAPPPQNNTAISQAGPIADMAGNNPTAINQSFDTLNSNVTALGSYFGIATTETQANFTQLQNHTSVLNNNMDILTGYVGQASGWIASLQGIQPAAQKVITALEVLEQRINAFELPGSKSSRRLAYE